MPNRSVFIAAGSLVLMAAGGLAWAAEKSGSFGSSRFERLHALDRDNDHAVTEAEYALGQERRFAERDGNKDGVLTASEIVFERKGAGNSSGRTGRFIARFDADKDGKLMRAELEQGQKALFAKRDKNGDGKLSADEAPRGFRRRGHVQLQGPDTLDVWLARANRRFETLDANKDGTVESNEAQAADAERRAYLVKREMHRFDANRDGKVTQDEYMMPAKRRFSGLDLDSDGRITAEDLPPNVRNDWNAGKK